MQIVAWSLIDHTEQFENDLKQKCETRGQKLSQLYNLQFDSAETCQSHPLEHLDYCE